MSERLAQEVISGKKKFIESYMLGSVYFPSTKTHTTQELIESWCKEHDIEADAIERPGSDRGQIINLYWNGRKG